jgi:hypothetical protein
LRTPWTADKLKGHAYSVTAIDAVEYSKDGQSDLIGRFMCPPSWPGTDRDKEERARFRANAGIHGSSMEFFAVVLVTEVN